MSIEDQYEKKMMELYHKNPKMVDFFERYKEDLDAIEDSEMTPKKAKMLIEISESSQFPLKINPNIVLSFLNHQVEYIDISGVKYRSLDAASKFLSREEYKDIHDDILDLQNAFKVIPNIVTDPMVKKYMEWFSNIKWYNGMYMGDEKVFFDLTSNAVSNVGKNEAPWIKLAPIKILQYFNYDKAQICNFMRNYAGILLDNNEMVIKKSTKKGIGRHVGEAAASAAISHFTFPGAMLFVKISDFFSRNSKAAAKDKEEAKIYYRNESEKHVNFLRHASSLNFK